MSNQFSLLKTRRFLPLFLTQYLGAFNDNIFKYVLVILITYATAAELGSDPALLVTAAAGIFILPFFLFSALAGQLADKYSKPRLIRILKMTEFMLMALAAFGFYWGNIYFLMFVLFLMGTQSSFFGPVKYSIIPELVSKDNLIGANGLVEAATFVAILLGTIIGGIFILKGGGVYIIFACVMAVAALGWISSRFIPDSSMQRPYLKITRNPIAETWRLIAQVRPNREIFRTILGISWFWTVGFVFLTHLPIYGKEILGANEDVVTLLLTFFSIGIGVGSLLCNKILKSKINTKTVPWGALGMGIAVLLFAVISPQPYAFDMTWGLESFWSDWQNIALLGTLALAAGFGGLYVVPLYTVLQTKSEAAFRSRTIAANNIMNALFMVAASLVSILLLKILPGVISLFSVVGIGNIMVAVLFWQGRKRR